jgi:succinyl-CoA synthetase beta subunit
MEIEEVARNFPEKIIKANFLPSTGLLPFQANRLALEIGMTGEAAKAAAKIFVEAARLFVSLDASLVEINPLCETKDGQIVAVDAKINADDNAAYRQAEIAQWQDASETDPNELEAAKYGLNYIKLDGNIGCLVNGAGLAMATMDTIRLYGATPANFLDVGGGATEEVVAAAFKILLNDKDVKAVLVNIFGGIMRCDVIAKASSARFRRWSSKYR